MPAQFTHLRSHTEFSIVDSSFRINDLIDRAKADGQPAVAITDINGMFGAIRFYSQARSAGVKAILGFEATIEGIARPTPDDPSAKDPDHHVLLLAENYQGYRKLMRLLSRGFTQNSRDGIPVLREEWLAEETSKDLFCLSGNENDAVGSRAAAGDSEGALEIAKRYSELFPQRYFLEVQRRGVPNETEYVQGVVNVADTLQLPLVATHPMQFAEREDYLAHEVKVCDKRGDQMHSRERERSFTPEQHFKTTAQMAEMFSDLPDALQNTVSIAQRCNVEIPLNTNSLPDFATPNGESSKEYFKIKTLEGFEKRLDFLYPDPAERAKQYPRYLERLNFEMDTIAKMGFEGYFLIVQDFIQWAKNHDIPVGPGRGSGAGSLVAYALTITDLDPLEYNLLFERFLNPDRVSMPDFDIDFCMDNREVVIDYVTRQYGAESVAGICNISTLQTKGAIKAAGRALGLHIGEVDGISKMIPEDKALTLGDILENDDALQERYNQSDNIKKLIDFAIKLEGLPHGIGKHASGVIISPGALTDFTPLYVPEGSTAVSQYDKVDVEQAGLVKFDFLGLQTLTELNFATKIIQKIEGQENFSLETLVLDDAKTYELFQRADTHSVFQFESGGMRNMLFEAKPDRFGDLIALVALYRPGPMDLIPDFNNRKHGRERVEYPDPRVEGILSETYGIMVYQEQVMQMAQIIGGYTLGKADLLRRAMGKKKAEEMAEHRQMFVDGAAQNGVGEKKAKEIFDNMEKFAGYGFNKSHAAAYALLSYQTAYLKTHFPSAFYAARLTVEGQKDTASIPGMIEDGEAHGLEVLAPDINHSEASFLPLQNDRNKLRYGLAGLKGLGKTAADLITQNRKSKGNYTSLLDFMEKNWRQVNKKGLEVLIKSGAFDTLHPNRAESLEFLPLAQKYLDKIAKSKQKQASALDEVFAIAGGAPTKKAKTRKTKVEEPLDVPEWPTLPNQELLPRLIGEKDSFGYYFSDHPYRYYKSQLGDLKACMTLEEVKNTPTGWDKHYIAGFVKELSVKKGSRGKFAIATVSDGTHEVELKLFSEVYEATKSWLKGDQFVLFLATIQEDRFRGGIQYQAKEAFTFDETKAILADNLNVALPVEKIKDLQAKIAQHPGPIQLAMWHPVEPSTDPTEKRASYVRAQSAPMGVKYDPDLFAELAREYGDKHVKLRYRQKLLPPVKNPPKNNGPKRSR